MRRLRPLWEPRVDWGVMVCVRVGSGEEKAWPSRKALMTRRPAAPDFSG